MEQLDQMAEELCKYKIKKLLPAEYEIRRKQSEIVFLQGFFMNPIDKNSHLS